mgnify:CR=1 FL=1
MPRNPQPSPAASSSSAAPPGDVLPVDVLPVDVLRDELLRVVADAPVVLSSPTGSGKSTQVPRWLRSRGRVLVVEPRRVACRSLAARVAELEGSPLGQAVGYRVRDEDRATAATEVLFVTPGVALRMLADGALDDWRSVVLDEFHERSLDTDLLLALLDEWRAARPERGLVVMSATVDVERLTAHLAGVALSAAGRLHPVEVRYRDDGRTLPHDRDLPQRVRAALDTLPPAGDVLVFLPGVAQIAACEQALASWPGGDCLPLHGSLSLDEQSRVFTPGPRRRVILATNVAETSLTVPGVSAVIDSGLVRRTRYHNGRGYLTLVPVALDSADQRAGRAGRLGSGVCVRLWSERARLDERTPPEVHRESLTPLLMAAAACGRRLDDLRFVDPPPVHAVGSARADLQALGALGEADDLTPTGAALFGLPLDPALGRLLVEALGTPVERDMIDLVAALAVGRPLWSGERPEDPADDLRAGGCDVEAMEGFGVLRAAQLAGVPAIEVRVISNVIEEADRRLWRFDDAFTAVAALTPCLVARIAQEFVHA